MTRPRKPKFDHKKKTITVFRELNPPSFNAWMLSKLQKENPEYTIVKEYDNA